MKLIKNKIYLFLFLSSFIFSENKIGLVLSGGGVKGFGHIGTLQIIDSLNIDIDYIAGTSIGSIAAALYASGYSADEIERISFKTNWDEIFSTNRDRNNLHFFQKRTDDNYQLSFNMKNYKPITPLGITNGQYSYTYLSRLFNIYTSDQSFDDMYIPFRCNAVDLISGEEIIFDRGSIAIALRASTSIPTVFVPIEYNNYLLVDGGIKNNLPTDILRTMGSESIIAINVSSDLKDKDDINSIVDIISSTINLSNFKNTNKNRSFSTILIEPKFKNINSIQFEPSLMNEIKNIGKKSAYIYIDEFIKYENKKEFVKLSSINNDFTIKSVYLNNNLLNVGIINDIFNPFLNISITKNIFLDQIEYLRDLKKYQNLHYSFKLIDENLYELYFEGEKIQPIILNNIIIKGNKKLSDRDILNIFNYNKGDTLEVDLLENDINEAYYLDYFQHLFYDINRIDSTNSDLIITVKESSFKKMHLGATWDNHYKLIGKFKIDLINKPYSNFRIENELLFSGIRKNIFTLYYTGTQNESLTIIPFFKNINSIQNIGYLSNNEIQFLDYDQELSSLGVIIPLKQYGFMSYSYNQQTNNYQDLINHNNDLTYYSIKLDLDQLDNNLIPEDGYHIIFNYDSAIDEDSDLDYSTLNLYFNFYKTFNEDHTLRVYNIYNKSLGDIPFHLNSFYGGYDCFIGYNEFDLPHNKLKSVGLEYQYHYKNSTTFRLMFNKITYIDFQDIESSNYSIKQLPFSYGIGITLKSILGPINFIWGRGIKNPYLSEDVKQNIFYFNFGVKY